jgi:hypothetical protein
MRKEREKTRGKLEGKLATNEKIDTKFLLAPLAENQRENREFYKAK